jgi:hypothetical protein
LIQLRGYSKFLFLVLSVISFFSFKTDPEPSKEIKMVRLGFYEAIQDSKKARPLSKIISSFNSTDAVIKVYEGASFAIMAQNKWNPFAAIKLLKKANLTMKKAVYSLPENIEIRFIRFAVQKNIPAFLRLSPNLIEDKKFIIDHVADFDASELDKKIRDYIIWFMTEQGGFEKKEIDLIKKQLS